MSGLTYATLQTLATSWTHRTDMAAQMPRFIALSEAEIFRELTLRNVEASVSGTTSGNTITLPADLAAFQRCIIQANGQEYTLDYTPPASARSLTGALGLPTRFTVENGVLRLYSAPDGPYSYTIFYLPQLTALSNTNTSNWLLENHEDVYLKSTLLQVAKFAKNFAEVDRLSAELGTALDSIKRSDERKRFPASGGMQIKPRSAR